MKYLFDTCIISELVKTKPNKKILKWIEDCDEESVFLSVLTIGEIQKGITKVKDESKKAALQRWLDIDLRERFAERILLITEEVALTWGVIQGEAELNGKPISTIDGLLVATAVAYNLTIVTRNEKDIQFTGVRIFNPWNL